MRVLQVTPRYFPNLGGVETVAQKLSESLVASGTTTTVFTVDLTRKLVEKQNVNRVLVKRFTAVLGDPLFLPNLRFLIAMTGEKADIVHVHNIHTLLPFLAALLKKKRQKLVLQPHYHRFGQTVFRHSLFRLYRLVVNHFVLQRTDAVIANSAYEKRILLQDFQKIRNVLLIPEGIDVKELKIVRRRPQKTKRVLYVGALRRYKNVDKIVEGFAQLTRTSGEDFKLVIVGDGTESASLHDLTCKLGIGDFVKWKHGLSRQQLLREYAEASVFILLSPLESFSRVAYEALLVGLPVVVLNSGATKHLVEARLAEGVSSLRPKEVADALQKAMKGSYHRISEHADIFLDWKQYPEEICHVYHVLLENP